MAQSHSVSVPLPVLVKLLDFQIRFQLLKREMTHQEITVFLSQVNDEGYDPHPVLMEAIDDILKETAR